jgi:hypothetical protein
MLAALAPPAGAIALTGAESRTLLDQADVYRELSSLGYAPG